MIVWDLAADTTFRAAREGVVKALKVAGRGDGGIAMRQLLLMALRRKGSRGRYVLGSGISLASLLLVVVGCANHSLVPAAQSAAIRNRERALASHAEAIQAAVKQSGDLGALAF